MVESLKNKQGLFITFEGGEGSGKSTQVKLLAKTLSALGRDVVLTREPGGTPEAEKVRDLLVRNDGGDWNALEQCMLFFTARAQHVRTLIKPALNAGKIVICDRFTDSTRAYQGYGLDLDLGTIEKVHLITMNSFEPDMTLLLDIPAKDGLGRSTRRLSEEGSDEDKYERLDIEFHEKLRRGFIELSERHADRFKVFDARDEISSLSKKINSYVLERLK